MKKFLMMLFPILLACSANAQYYEEIFMDSMQRIVNNPNTKDADRIDPLARLYRRYVSRGDSVAAKQALTRARVLASREKDSKYMIYVHFRELMVCQNDYPKKITRAYQIIDSLYIAIKKTSDLEAQALGYCYIGQVKNILNPEYDFSDSYKALQLAETLPENSMVKYRVMGNTYYSLFTRYVYTDHKSAKKYLDLLQQTAEKWGDKDFQSRAMSFQLGFNALFSAKDTALITREFVALENYISENSYKISPFEYGLVISTLIEVYPSIPNAQYLKKLENHIETFKKMAGNSYAIKVQLLNIQRGYALIQKNYAEAINAAHQKIALVGPAFPVLLSDGYKTLAMIYSLTGQYKQAYEALDTCLRCQLQYQNAKLDEQHQLAEVKFGVEKKDILIKQQRSQLFIISIGAMLVLVICILLVWLLNKKRHIKELEKERAELIARQALEEKEKLDKKLLVNKIELNRKERLIEKAKDMDKEQLSRAIRYEQKKSKLTGDRSKLFNEIDSQFYKRLQEQAHPNKLSNNDLMYCAYISLRMNNKELAHIMNVEYTTVVSQKYRLKKKLHLSENDDLETFIINLPPP